MASSASPQLLKPDSHHLPRFIAAGALVLFAVYGSDVALMARPDLFLGLEDAQTTSSARPAQLWAYVPIAAPADASA